MKQKTVLYIVLIAIATLCLIGLYKGQSLPYAPQEVSGPVLNAPMRYEVVDTPEEREKGLSGRTHLESDQGLLFIFEEKDVYGFWMKDMLMAIDIIWLSDNGTILGIEHSVQPNTYPSIFYPPVPVKYVLEVAAGNAQARGWSTGTAITIPLQD